MVGNPGTALTSMDGVGEAAVDPADPDVNWSGTSTDAAPCATTAVSRQAPSSDRLAPVAVKTPGAPGARSSRDPPMSGRAGKAKRSATPSAATGAPLS